MFYFQAKRKYVCYCKRQSSVYRKANRIKDTVNMKKPLFDVAVEQCFICLSKTDLYQCSLCKLFMCQRHKTIHKDICGNCYPFKVEYREKFGRILAATRKIKKGELIFRE